MLHATVLNQQTPDNNPMLRSPLLQVMLLLASAPRNPFAPNDLSTSGKLQFRVHARELGSQSLQLLDVDLSPLVHLPARRPQAVAAGPLSNGHQTMVIAGVYTVSAGFCVTTAQPSTKCRHTLNL